MSDKKWSTADKSTKLIFEGWKKFLKEEKEEKTVLNEWEGFKAMGRKLIGRKQPHERLKLFLDQLTKGYEEMQEWVKDASRSAQQARGSRESELDDVITQSRASFKNFEAEWNREYYPLAKSTLSAPKGSQIKKLGLELWKAIGDPKNSQSYGGIFNQWNYMNESDTATKEMWDNLDKGDRERKRKERELEADWKAWKARQAAKDSVEHERRNHACYKQCEEEYPHNPQMASKCRQRCMGEEVTQGSGDTWLKYK
tara:strand:+ start:3467 stop:4231 length:765 start_codon:yes stop_codon:yes gene_type:complete